MKKMNFDYLSQFFQFLGFSASAPSTIAGSFPASPDAAASVSVPPLAFWDEFYQPLTKLFQKLDSFNGHNY
jgi:hypothetical protein